MAQQHIRENYRAFGQRRTQHFRLILTLLTFLFVADGQASPATIGGPFQLIKPDGTTVTETTYKGKWLLVYFGYTHCPDSCPATLLAITQALKDLGPEADQVQPIFITIDPRRDTAQVMGEYTQSFDPRIIGLTGSQQQIDSVAHAYGVYAAPYKTGSGAQDYVVDHGTYIYVMDPDGNFKRAFDESVSRGEIAATLRKFMFDSRL